MVARVLSLVWPYAGDGSRSVLSAEWVWRCLSRQRLGYGSSEACSVPVAAPLVVLHDRVSGGVLAVACAWSNLVLLMYGATGGAAVS